MPSFLFQSTCPARGTTNSAWAENVALAFQSTCPARGTTLVTLMPPGQLAAFQSTCPARGTTDLGAGFFRRVEEFQSTCPARGTTQQRVDGKRSVGISIHVPREGHDEVRHGYAKLQNHFNPRAPRGARRKAIPERPDRRAFQSTCPARGTTQRERLPDRCRHISIHVPREGHDESKPRPARGAKNISIHVPREGHDSGTATKVSGTRISIHVPREGHD